MMTNPGYTLSVSVYVSPAMEDVSGEPGSVSLFFEDGSTVTVRRDDDPVKWQALREVLGPVARDFGWK